MSFATPRGPQEGRIDTDSWGPGFAIARFSGITPALFVNLTTPIDWELTRSIKLYRVERRGDSDEDRARVQRVGEALVRDLRKQMEEDIVIFDHKIWVDPPARRNGNASRALRDLIRLLLARVPTVCLFVRAENAPAIRLYETVGMRHTLAYRSVLF